MKKLIITLILAAFTVLPLLAQQVLYVNKETGKNRNDGSKTMPLKNIQKAVDIAEPGALIRVAEGNYFGNLDNGNIKITKPVTDRKSVV